MTLKNYKKYQHISIFTQIQCRMNWVGGFRSYLCQIFWLYFLAPGSWQAVQIYLKYMCNHRLETLCTGLGIVMLTHWGRAMYICISKMIIIGSDNGLLPGRRQAIIWTNAGIFFIWPLGTIFSEIWIQINIFSWKKLLFKMFANCWPFCLSLNVLTCYVLNCFEKTWKHFRYRISHHFSTDG